MVTYRRFPFSLSAVCESESVCQSQARSWPRIPASYFEHGGYWLGSVPFVGCRSKLQRMSSVGDGVTELTPECSDEDAFGDAQFVPEEQPLDNPVPDVEPAEPLTLAIAESAGPTDEAVVAEADSLVNTNTQRRDARKASLQDEIRQRQSSSESAEEDFGRTTQTTLSHALTLGGELVEVEQPTLKPRPYVPFDQFHKSGVPSFTATWPGPKPRVEQIMDFIHELAQDTPAERRRQKRKAKHSGQTLPGITEKPRAFAFTRAQRGVRQSLLPSCANFVSAPKIKVQGSTGQEAIFTVSSDKESMDVWLDYLATELNEDIPIRQLFDEQDNVLQHKRLAVGNTIYYVRNSKQRAARLASTGRARSVSPCRNPLIKHTQYEHLCKGASRHPKPVQVTVRSNRWNTTPAPSRFAQNMLVVGSARQELC